MIILSTDSTFRPMVRDRSSFVVLNYNPTLRFRGVLLELAC